MLRKLHVFVLGMALSGPAFAAEPIIRTIPDARIVGQGKLSMAFWDIYKAVLYAPDGRLTHRQPFALSIHYMREIDGSDIAERSVIEIRNQGFRDEAKLATWNAQMKNIFPNVEDGTVLSAIFLPGKETIFYNADKQIGVIKDAEFTLWFANIWLSEKTSEPNLRQKLLGLS